MKNLGLYQSIILATLSFGHLSQAEDIATREYDFKVHPNSITCRPGVPPNGHNYPVQTTVMIPTYYSSSAISYPTKLPYNNTAEVTLEEPRGGNNYLPCSAYADLLKGSEYLSGHVVQKFSTRTDIGPEECFKTMREDLEVTVSGHIFRGSEEFHFILEKEQCRL